MPAAAGAAARTVEAFHAALGRGDAEAALALLDRDVVISEEGDAELTRADYGASHLAADIAFLSAARETVTSRTGGASGDLAWVSALGRVEGQLGARPVSRQTAETMVLRRSQGAWRIIHIHWSSRAAAAGAR